MIGQSTLQGLIFIYFIYLRIVFECQLFHTLKTFHPADVGSLAAPRKKVKFRKPNAAEGGGVSVREEQEEGYSDLAQLLHHHHYQTSVLGLKDRVWTQDALVARILAGGYNHEGNHFGGFVLLSLGQTATRREDPVGFCLQRCPTKVSELGDFTRSAALASCGGDAEEAEALLRKFSQNPLTVLRQSFDSSEGECVNLDYLRFLITKVGLCNFKLHHFVHYRHGKYLDGFLDDLQQLRHDLKKSGGSELMQNAIKLTMNSCYGHSFMSPANFTSTTIVTETTLGQATHRRQLEPGGRITQLTLLGATSPDFGYPDLIFAATRSRVDAKILNIIQMGASILSSSRVIFLGILYELLDLLDPFLAQLCYAGKNKK